MGGHIECSRESHATRVCKLKRACQTQIDFKFRNSYVHDIRRNFPYIHDLYLSAGTGVRGSLGLDPGTALDGARMIPALINRQESRVLASTRLL